MIFNCLPEGENLADLVRRERVESFEVVFCRDVSADQEDTDTEVCPPNIAEFATIIALTDLGEAIAVHDVDLTNAGADSLALACGKMFAAIIAASRKITEIRH